LAAGRLRTLEAATRRPGKASAAVEGEQGEILLLSVVTVEERQHSLAVRVGRVQVNDDRGGRPAARADEKCA
jgi:hypothetical protein